MVSSPPQSSSHSVKKVKSQKCKSDVILLFKFLSIPHYLRRKKKKKLSSLSHFCFPWIFYSDNTKLYVVPWKCMPFRSFDIFLYMFPLTRMCFALPNSPCPLSPRSTPPMKPSSLSRKVNQYLCSNTILHTSITDNSSHNELHYLFTSNCNQDWE